MEHHNLKEQNQSRMAATRQWLRRVVSLLSDLSGAGALVLGGGAAVLALAAKYLRGLTEPVRWSLTGAAIALLILLLVAGVWSFARSRRSLVLRRTPSAVRHQPPSEIIEIGFGDSHKANTYVGIMPAYDSPTARAPSKTTLDAYFDGLRVANNDRQDAIIDDVWMELDGTRPDEILQFRLEPVEPAQYRVRPDRQVPGYSPRSYSLRYTANFAGVIADENVRGHLELCVKLLGLGTFCRTVPDWAFTPQGRRE